MNANCSYTRVELRGGRRGFIAGRKHVDGIIFIVHHLLLTTSLIVLTLLLIICLKINNYDCMLITKKNC
jgi:hypothetical protein